MKRRLLTVLFALLLLLLCGCAALVPSEYTLVTPHNPGTKTEQQSDVLTVSNYKMLKNALRTLVQNGVEHGVIHTSQYEADIEADLPQAVYEIAREDPIGAYAIDYITHDCTLIVAYYEIKVDITFRDVLTPLDEIEYVGGENEAGRLISRALEDYDDHLTLYATYPGRPDYAALVQNYCDSHLREHAAEPELTVTEYPADARNRIVELVFSYPASRRGAAGDAAGRARVWRRQRSTSATVRARRRRPRCCLPIWPSASRISRATAARRSIPRSARAWRTAKAWRRAGSCCATRRVSAAGPSAVCAAARPTGGTS